MNCGHTCEKLFDGKRYLREFNQRNQFTIRPLEWPDDYEKGICDVLGQLTVCDTGEETFEKVFRRMRNQKDTFVVVAHRNSDDSVLGCGTVFIESKFIHRGKACAHIEDIVVTTEARGQHVGQAIIESLVCIARNTNSYKVILNCTENNVGFYEKCGFTRHEVEMTYYFTQ